MDVPLSTGQVAQLLGTTEPKLAETVRRARVRPAPPIQAGRRLWGRHHILQAATALGVLTPGLRAQLEVHADPAIGS
jgi:hypothetical protein